MIDHTKDVVKRSDIHDPENNTTYVSKLMSSGTTVITPFYKTIEKKKKKYLNLFNNSKYDCF